VLWRRVAGAAQGERKGRGEKREGEERRKRERERRADRWVPLPCDIHVSKTTSKTTTKPPDGQICTVSRVG